MTFPKLAVFIFLVLTSSAALAQTNFLPGYYISNGYDTVKGFIEYRTDSRLYEACIYRLDKGSKSVRFSAAEIRGFAILNKQYFESGEVTREGKTDIIFFKLIGRGKLSLYHYGRRYFVKADGKMQEITVGKTSSETKMRTDYKGAGVLKLLMADCPLTADGFIEKSYMKPSPDYNGIFRQYHECIGMQYLEAEEIDHKMKFGFGVQTGVCFTHLDFTGVDKMDGADFGAPANVTLTAVVSLFIPHVTERLRILLVPTYGQYDQYAFFVNGHGTNDVFFRYSYLRIPILVRYSYKFLFAEAGLYKQFYFNQTPTWRVEQLSGNVVNTQAGPHYIIDPKRRFDYMIGAGFKANVMSIPVRLGARYTINSPFTAGNPPKMTALEVNLSLMLYGD